MSVDKKITVVIGKTGCGKSYLVNKLNKEKQHLLVFDTMSEYTEGVVFEKRPEFLQFWQQFYQHPYRLIYRPLDNPENEIEDIAECVYLLGNVCFVIEEVTCYCSPNKISENFAHIIQRGRHKNIELIVTTQRPFGLHRLLTSQAKEIYVFATNEPRDIDYLCALLGREIEEKLSALQQYQYIKWEDGKDGFEIGKA